MGACCGKPDRKGQGHVLGGANTSTVVPAGQRLGTTAGKAKLQQQSQTPASPSSQGQTLGGSSQTPPTGELSASALAAQKRAEAVSVKLVSKLSQLSTSW